MDTSPTRLPKIAFCGWGRSGKDEAAYYLSTITKLRYAGSFSWAALPHMAKILGQHPQVAWDNRHKHREFWKAELDKLRENDPCFLARLVLEQGEITAGIRDVREIRAFKEAGLFDYLVWIDRPGTPPDSTVTYTSDECNVILQNNGTLDYFHQLLEIFATRFNLPMK